MHATGKHRRARQEGTWSTIIADMILGHGGTMTLWCIMKTNVGDEVSSVPAHKAGVFCALLSDYIYT